MNMKDIRLKRKSKGIVAIRIEMDFDSHVRLLDSGDLQITRIAPDPARARLCARFHPCAWRDSEDAGRSTSTVGSARLEAAKMRPTTLLSTMPLSKRYDTDSHELHSMSIWHYLSVNYEPHSHRHDRAFDGQVCAPDRLALRRAAEVVNGPRMRPRTERRHARPDRLFTVARPCPTAQARASGALLTARPGPRGPARLPSANPAGVLDEGSKPCTKLRGVLLVQVNLILGSSDAKPHGLVRLAINIVSHSDGNPLRHAPLPAVLNSPHSTDQGYAAPSSPRGQGTPSMLGRLSRSVHWRQEQKQNPGHDRWWPDSRICRSGLPPNADYGRSVTVWVAPVRACR